MLLRIHLSWQKAHRYFFIYILYWTISELGTHGTHPLTVFHPLINPVILCYLRFSMPSISLRTTWGWQHNSSVCENHNIVASSFKLFCSLIKLHRQVALADIFQTVRLLGRSRLHVWQSGCLFQLGVPTATTHCLFSPRLWCCWAQSSLIRMKLLRYTFFFLINVFRVYFCIFADMTWQFSVFYKIVYYTIK